MESSVKIEPGDRIVVTNPNVLYHGKTFKVSRVGPEGVFATLEGSTATTCLAHDSYQLLKPNATTITALVRIKELASAFSNAQWQTREGRLWPVEASDSEGVWIRSEQTGVLQMFAWNEIEIDPSTPLQPPATSAPKSIATAVLTDECMTELVERTAARVVQLLREGPPWTATSISSSTGTETRTGKTSKP